MKSQQKTFVTGAWEAMFKDMASVYPELTRSFARDSITLRHQIEHRGFGFLTLDLPLLDDLLLEGLERGALPECFYLHGKSSKARVPRLFQGLWLRVFDDSGCLLEEADTCAIFFLRQLALMWKKLERECSGDRLRKAVDEYLSIESDLLPPTLRWGETGTDFLNEADSLSISFADFSGGCDNVNIVPGIKPEHVSYHSHHTKSTRRSLKALDTVAHRFCSRLPVFSPFYLENTVQQGSRGSSDREGPSPSGKSAFRHGPGAVADRPPGNKNLFDKNKFPTWSARLADIFPFYPFGATSLHRLGDIPPELDVPSKLIAVPKTQKSPRLIASEPTANQWCQQTLAGYFHQNTKFIRHLVNTKDQNESRAMVLKSSIDRSLATIDLSSASDRLSCRVVERIFASRPDILIALNAVRTSHTVNGIRKTQPFLIKTKKYATQGTACTFPIQSLVFTLIALAACGYSYEQARGKVRVFGDDIIVPKVHVHKVIELLHSLGLRVNERKSFASGYFRESCGQDAYKGDDVTPCKFEQLPNASKPTTIQSMFDYQNNLHKKGLWNLAHFVRMHCEFAYKRRISNGRLDDSAVYSFSGSTIAHLRWRMVPDQQRKEVRVAFLLNKAKSSDREPLSRLMLNQHSYYGETFTAEMHDRPQLVKAWKWEDARAA